MNFFCFILVVMGLSASNFLCAEGAPRIVGAYYDSSSQYRPPSGNRRPFSPSMIETGLLTDLYYAFAYFGYVTKSVDANHPHLTGDFSIQPTDSNDQTVLYPQIQALKARSGGSLKVFLSIGDWNFNDPNDPQGAGKETYRLFSQMVSIGTNRKQFIDSAIAYAHKYGFDGIDIDWEYPGDLQRGGSIEDFSNFVTFLKECSEAFHNATPPLLLSYAAPSFVPVGLPKSYRDDPSTFYRWIAECARYLDRINVMAYDYHIPFGDANITGANAPLNRDTNPNSTYFIARTLENYLSNGVPANKIVLGVPIFGHSYDGVMGLGSGNDGPGKPFVSAGAPGPSTKMAGFLSYYEVADMVAQKKLVFGADTLTSTAYGYDISGSKWVSFDTPDTIALKAQVAMEKGLGGVVFWTIDMDEYEWHPGYPNIRSGRKVLVP